MIVDPMGNAIVREFDAYGHVVSETSPLGTMTWTRDPAGNILSETDRLGNVTQYSYTSSGKLSSITDPNGHTTTYGYDEQGRLVSRTDPLGNETTYAYNYAGQVASVTDADGKTTTFTYAPNGQRAVTKHPDGTTHTRDYTPFGLVSGEQFVDPDGTVSVSRSFTYGTKGLLQEMRAGDSSVLYTGYDTVGQVTGITDQLTGKSFTITYDPTTGFRSALTGPQGTQSYTYDPYGNVASIVTPEGGVFRFEYDRFNRMTRKVYPNRASETRTYDDYGRLTSIVHWDASGAIVAGEAYTYDAMGRLVGVTDEEGQETTYTYDAAGQLTEVAGPDEHRRFEYDAAGNRIRTWENDTLVETCSFNALNQVTSCDRQGTTVTFTYDDRGNLVEENVGGVTTTYTYDAADQLVQADGPSGTVQFAYDARGRRIAVSDATGTRYFVYDDTQLLLELDGDMNVVRSFVRGPVVDDLLAVTTYTGTPATTYFHADARHSVMALSGEAGTLTTRYRYTVFGGLAGGGTGVDNVWTFAGRPWDPVVSGYDFRARWYRPDLGRFLQRDPLRLETFGVQRTSFASMLTAANRQSFTGYLAAPLSQHPYAYANNAPTLYWDPSGEGALELVIKYLAAYVFAEITIATGTRFFPVIWTNVLLGQAYSWELGPSVVGAVSDPCMLRDPVGLLIGYVWANAIDAVIKPMRAELFPNPSNTQIKWICITRMMKVGENWKKQMTKKAASLVHGVDCVPPGMLFWVIMAWQTYFLLLDYWMIYLFQMPGFSINVPAECSCYNWP